MTEDGAIFGAWDLIATYASKEMFDKVINSYKRGKYLQGVIIQGHHVQSLD